MLLDSLGKRASRAPEPLQLALFLGDGGGAALQEQGVAAVAHSHRLGVGGQGQLVTGARVAEDVATVSAVVLADRKEAVTGHAVLPFGFQSSLTTRARPPRCTNLEGVPPDLCFYIYVPVKSMECWGVHLQE